MRFDPRLLTTRHVEHPDAVVLVLHGGGSRRGNMAVSPTQLSVLRMIPIARAVARRGEGRLAVMRLLNSVRGWDTRLTPVDDVRWAMQQAANRYRDVKVALVGHSLGGRAALLAGRTESVAGIVALNPFLYPQDAEGGRVRGKVLVVQGTEDRISRPDRTMAVATAMNRDADVRVALITGGRHAMLRRHRAYTDLAAEFTAHVLLGDHPIGLLDRLLGNADTVWET